MLGGNRRRPSKIVGVNAMKRDKTNLVAYFSIFGFLYAYAKGDRENCRFHLNQGLVLGLFELLLLLVDLLGRTNKDAVFSVVFSILFLALLALLVTGVWVGAASAVRGKERKAPLLGRINLINRNEFNEFKISSCHNHTVFSDGQNTPEQMVISAVKNGLTAVGISDHIYTPHDERYCMKKEAEFDYISTVKDLKQRFADKITVAIGAELDLFSQKTDKNKYDYIIGSVHYIKREGKYYPIDDSKQDELYLIDEVYGGDETEFCRDYYNEVVQNVADNRPDIVGHFDLITKFGLIDENSEQYRKIALDAVDKILEYDPIFEVNTGAVAKEIRRVPYPARFILEHLKEKGARVTVNSDAHCADNIAFGFANALALLKDVGFKEITVLTASGFGQKPLDTKN